MWDNLDSVDPNELFPMLGDEIGAIHSAKQMCPGVYYINVSQKDEVFAKEYFVVTSSSAISRRARSYGRNCCGLWLYSLDDDTGGWRIVEYEVGKICTSNGWPLPHDLSLHNIAVYAAEYHPEYFGAYPAPLLTPRGYTLRYRVLENGIYWIETNRCEEVLAVCYPIWSSELTGLAERVGELNEYDAEHGVHETFGYMFFPKRTSCIPIYELLNTRPNWAGKLIDKPLLMNAIWKICPEYAIQINHQEQLNANGQTASLSKHVISISQVAGEDYLLFD